MTPTPRPTRPKQASRRSKPAAKVSRTVPRGRLALVVVGSLIGFTALVAKLAMLQAISPQRYAELARDQRTVSETLAASRGSILDRNGELLVTSVNKPTIWADPSQVKDADRTAAKLAPLLKLDESAIRRDLSVAGSQFTYLARQVTPAVASAVQALKLPGIYATDEPTRYAPAQDLGASILGSVDTDSVGIAGIELQFDAILTGAAGKLVQEESRDGHRIPAGRNWTVPAEPGKDVVLTIDRNLQYLVEHALVQQVAATKAKRGTAILGNPQTGEILAMASVETPKGGTPRTVAQNLAVSWQFEPGSVMKPVTISAGLETQGLTERSVFNVPSYLTIYDSTFVDTHKSADDLTVTQILAESSNVGTIEVALQVGRNHLADYLHEFGFGQSTGVSLPREEPGSLPLLEDWSGTSLPTLAIGQALLVTPMQLFAAYAAIANGGELITPTLVAATVDSNGERHPLPASNRKRIISSGTAAQLRRMLAQAVADGTGTLAQVPGYNVAGKTGTAWKVQADGTYGSDGDRTYTATFAGFVPADVPRLVAVVVVDEPGGKVFYGGEAAAPVFAAITQPALVALDIAPVDPKLAPATGPIQNSTTTQSTALSTATTQKARALPALAAPIPPVTVPTTVKQRG